MVCVYCESGELVRAHRQTFSDHLFACAGLYPYICKKCRRRRLRPSLEQTSMAACFALLAVAALATAAVFAYRMPHASLPGRGSPAPDVRLTPVAQTEAQAPVLDWRNILRNEDIVELSRSGLAGEVIAKLISKSPRQFEVDTKSLASMKRSGVKDEVIALIIDVSLSAPPSTAPTSPTPSAPRTPSAPTGTPGGTAPVEHAPIVRAAGGAPAATPAPPPVAAPSPTAFSKIPASVIGQGIGGGTN